MSDFSRTIPLISQTVNQSSMLLLSEICELVSYCMSFKRSLIDQITRQLDIVQSLISFLNVDLFGKFIEKPLKSQYKFLLSLSDRFIFVFDFCFLY